ncbi:hypothetical protein J6590_031391 [Homalodisca vitripennis]|nr:hypothetical protein J6590_031391 [Homalodisca vitripennis]
MGRRSTAKDKVRQDMAWLRKDSAATTIGSGSLLALSEHTHNRVQAGPAAILAYLTAERELISYILHRRPGDRIKGIVAVRAALATFQEEMKRLRDKLETRGEDTDKLVVELCREKLGMKLSGTAIHRSHRIGQQISASKCEEVKGLRRCHPRRSDHTQNGSVPGGCSSVRPEEHLNAGWTCSYRCGRKGIGTRLADLASNSTGTKNDHLHKAGCGVAVYVRSHFLVFVLLSARDGRPEYMFQDVCVNETHTSSPGLHG